MLKICQIPHVIFESTSHCSFKFCINIQCCQKELFCTFLAQTWYTLVKSSALSANFWGFECSDDNLPKSLCHFANCKEVFLQILHFSWVSWKVIPHYFFRSKIIYFAPKEPIKVQILETWVPGWKFTKFFSILKPQIGFCSNFASIFSINRLYSSVIFLAEIVYTFNKGAYQSTNLVKLTWAVEIF